MTEKDFGEVFNLFVKLQKEILTRKSGEYSRNNDKLHNFKYAGQCLNCTPEKALSGMAVKHNISILDIIDDVEEGKIPDITFIEEKLVDYGNYIILLYALLVERIQDDIKNSKF